MRVGQHAIEHIDAARHSFDNVGRGPHSHKIAWLVDGQQRSNLLDHAQHHLLRLADREAPDGVACKTDIHENAGALAAQRRIIAALCDAEQTPPRRAACKGALAAFGPAERKPHGALDLAARGRQLEAFVELHDDVGAEKVLNFDRAFGRQLDGGAVEMRAKGDAVLLHPAQLRTAT